MDYFAGCGRFDKPVPVAVFSGEVLFFFPPTKYQMDQWEIPTEKHVSIRKTSNGEQSEPSNATEGSLKQYQTSNPMSRSMFLKERSLLNV